MDPCAGNPQPLHPLRAFHISAHAAHACYFLILSLFPALVVLLGLLRAVALQPEDLLELVSAFLPDALLPQAWAMVLDVYESSTRPVLSLSALATLWSAGRGIYALQEGLCSVYGTPAPRSWLLGRILCTGYALLFILVLLLTLVVQVFGATVLRFLRLRTGLQLWIDLAALRYFLLIGLQTLLFCAMFMFLPGTRRRFLESLPGALLGSFGWMSASSLFSVYVRCFPKYAGIFGSVYGVALGGFWLYICVSIFFYGALLNRILARNRR